MMYPNEIKMQENYLTAIRFFYALGGPGQWVAAVPGPRKSVVKKRGSKTPGGA